LTEVYQFLGNTENSWQASYEFESRTTIPARSEFVLISAIIPLLTYFTDAECTGIKHDIEG